MRSAPATSRASRTALASAVGASTKSTDPDHEEHPVDEEHQDDEQTTLLGHRGDHPGEDDADTGAHGASHEA